MFKKALKLAGFGFIVGIAVFTVISAFTYKETPVPSEFVEKVGSFRAAYLIQIALSGAYGALCMGTTVIYDAEKLPLSVMSLLHCVITVSTYIPLSLFLGWSDSPVNTLITTCIQVAAYFVIWLIMFLRYRKEIKELNEMNNKKDAEDDGK
jgi:hypothetical protein